MVLVIQRVTCNVTVRAAASNLAMESSVNRAPSPQVSTVPTAAVQRTLKAEESAPAEENSPATSVGRSEAAPIDSKKLADEVYRLMRDDLRIARERE